MTTVVRFKLRSRRQGAPVAPPVQAELQPSPAALALAQAYWFLAMLDDGVVKNQAELARLCGLSRMRVSQIMALLELPPEAQAQLLEEAWTSSTSIRSATRVGAGRDGSTRAHGPAGSTAD